MQDQNKITLLTNVDAAFTDTECLNCGSGVLLQYYHKKINLSIDAVPVREEV